MASNDAGLLAKIDRIWMLAPFKKALDKRSRELTLLSALSECVSQLFANPRHPGLNLEALRGPVGHPVLSARIDRSFRVILTPLRAREVGLLYFDNHDEAYRWVDRNREQIPTMLTRVEELAPLRPIVKGAVLLPTVQADEDEPLALSSAAEWKRAMAQGIERYLAYLDDEQRRVAELQTRSLLLVKGGAGTGKTAVAIHRALWLARQPVLDSLGADRVLYLCFNRALASVVEQTVRSLCAAAPRPNLEIRTIHSWCLNLLNEQTAQFSVDDELIRMRTYREFGRLTAGQKSALAPHDGSFVHDEIEQVVKANGLVDRTAYQTFNRRGRSVSLKQAARDAVWHVYEQVRAWQLEAGRLTWNDVPLQALALLHGRDECRYRALVIDEGQDCTPVMIRLARRLIGADGQLTVLADPAQEIYDCGFQWTRQELGVRGGNTRWLRKSYRTTREIYDLARPLLAEATDLADDLAHLDPPVRRGQRPVAVACADATELYREMVERIGAAASHRPPNQVGVVAATHQELGVIARGLAERGVRHQVCGRGGGDIRLTEPSVKLLTMHAAKGLDFPEVFVLAPRVNEMSWEVERDAECRRRLYVALTRSSERLSIGLVYGRHHRLVGGLDPVLLEVAGSRSRELLHTFG